MKEIHISKTIVLIGLILSLVLALPLLIACGTTPAPTPTPTSTIAPTPTQISYANWKPTTQVVTVAAGQASTITMAALGMEKGIGDKTGVTFNNLIAEKTGERAQMLKGNMATIGFLPAGNALIALEAKLEYQELGPQSYRCIWNGGSMALGLFARGDSGIKTINDIKGKRVAQYAPASPFEQYYYIEPALAYANLTWNDVIATPVGSYAEAGRGIIDGSVDVAFLATTAPQTAELAASIHGIQWLQMPNKTDADKAAWERYHKVNPGHFPITTTVGGGISADKPVDVFGYNAQVIMYDWQDPKLAYWMTKNIAEDYAAYQGNHAYLPSWTLDHSLDVSTWFMPWHEGSVQYFKDAGRWTAAMEAKQQELLAKYPQKMTK